MTMFLTLCSKKEFSALFSSKSFFETFDFPRIHFKFRPCFYKPTATTHAKLFISKFLFTRPIVLIVKLHLFFFVKCPLAWGIVPRTDSSILMNCYKCIILALQTCLVYVFSKSYVQAWNKQGSLALEIGVKNYTRFTVGDFYNDADGETEQRDPTVQTFWTRNRKSKDTQILH